VRRGVALSVGLLVGVLTEMTAPAAVPAALAMGTVQAAVLTVAGQAAAGAIPANAAALTKGVLRAMFVSKLKVAAAVALAVVVAAGLVAGARRALADKPPASEKKEAPREEEKILGTWVITSAERGNVAQDRFKDLKATFTADGKWITHLPDGDREGAYKLNTAKKPKEIDLVNAKGNTMLGIYKLEKDALTICLGEEDTDERPTEFASKEGTRVVLLVLQREKK
jgi:uncharacterized protein (TIGR03067 family)